MSAQVSLGKRRTIVETLSRRIWEGEYEPGQRLEGELKLAEEFGVSRGTVRQALSELQHRSLIATEGGRGSFVIFDGHQLDQQFGWAHALAAAGGDVDTRLLGIERVRREEIPLLPEKVVLEEGLCVRRVRRLRPTAEQGGPISFECATVPSEGDLRSLPTDGLVDGSLSTTLQQAGLVPARGTQSVDVRPLDEREARILHRDPGIAFLRTARTSFTSDGRFVEHVVSLLDPAHFTLSLTFGDE
ncbi:GntR family transcriptional regulator [Brachybacterium sp. AOP43-C2-M15]|uniref:GntR family transcriptional regulator n=1 Tax=Brachybacterium sp. AOP43-C2-M15 TaxID=3457661 RepID=UPI0040345713